MGTRRIVVALSVVAVGVLVLVGLSRSDSPTPASTMSGVSVVLAHRTINTNSGENEVVVNRTSDWLYSDLGAGPWPDTGKPFTSIPANLALCLNGLVLVRPHSQLRIQLGFYCTSLWYLAPGHYWVVFPYQVDAHRPSLETAPHGFSATRYLAITKLTVTK